MEGEFGERGEGGVEVCDGEKGDFAGVGLSACEIDGGVGVEEGLSEVLGLEDFGGELTFEVIAELRVVEDGPEDEEVGGERDGEEACESGGVEDPGPGEGLLRGVVGEACGESR